mmetsp:Transcript_70607/g.117244  ORF Transcript_70607/g.117244 Transcript_70607/m.117244 type:complete len:179 (+) Transcript_70607:73-609(+)
MRSHCCRRWAAIVSFCCLIAPAFATTLQFACLFNRTSSSKFGLAGHVTNLTGRVNSLSCSIQSSTNSLQSNTLHSSIENANANKMCTFEWCSEKNCSWPGGIDTHKSSLPLTDEKCEDACVKACPEIPISDVPGGKGCSVGHDGNFDCGKVSPLGPQSGQCRCFIGHPCNGFFGITCR